MAEYSYGAIRACLVFGLVFGLILAQDCRAADAWTPEEKVGETIYLSLHTIDWLQTRYIATHPVCGAGCEFHEINPVLGRHPSVDSVDIYFAVTTILQPIIANALPKKWRAPWIAAGVMLEFSLAAHNASIGIRIDLP